MQKFLDVSDQTSNVIGQNTLGSARFADHSMEATGGVSSGSATVKTPKNTAKRKPKAAHDHQNEQLIAVVSSIGSAVRGFLTQNDLCLLPSQTLSLESLLASLPFPHSPPPPPPPPAQSSLFSRFLSSASSDVDPRWADFFRMSKPTFSQLLSLLSPSLPASLPSAVSPDSALAAALFRLSHGASYSFVARAFGLDSPDAACLSFYAVCKAVNEKFGNLFELRRDWERIVVGFGWISLPNCCGVLGIGKFGIDSEALGKKGSLLVQALVDSEGRFLDISAGWPSSMKAESIFQQSRFYSGVEETREGLDGPCFELGDGNSIPQYILGDSYFPLLPWLLTPYFKRNEINFSSEEKQFNVAHRRAVALVNTAFGRVKARWQLLARRWKEECAEFFPFVIVMGCLLHNFLINCGEPLPEESAGGCFKEEQLPVFQGKADEKGRRFRDLLAQHLSRVSMRR